MLEQILIAAVIIEAVIEYIKCIANRKFNPACLFSIILGVVAAILFHMDLLSVFGLYSPVPLVGNVVTGVLLSRGSNYVYDLIAKLKGKA